MPTYEYIAEDPEKSCRICGKGFELKPPAGPTGAYPLPLLQEPGQKADQPHQHAASQQTSLLVSDAKSAGFTILKNATRAFTKKFDRSVSRSPLSARAFL